MKIKLLLVLVLVVVVFSETESGGGLPKWEWIVAVFFSFLGFSHVVDMSFYLEMFLTRQQMLRTIHKLTRAVIFIRLSEFWTECIGELLNFDYELNCMSVWVYDYDFIFELNM
jgi:hypothetical protein